MTLENKTIIVTGAASGIGAATDELLRSRGADTIRMDLKEPEDGRGRYVPVDLAQEDSILEAAKEVTAMANGSIDALCNIAGLPPTAGPAPVIAINFLGTRLLTNALAGSINAGGAIVTVASTAGNAWQQNMDVIRPILAAKGPADAGRLVDELGISEDRCYFTSKEAVVAWTVSQWSRYAERDIAINAVSPGPVETPILPDFIESIGERATRGIARIGRPGKPQEVAELIAFLCSSEAHWIRGANLLVDGGHTANMLCNEYDLY